MNWRHHDSTLDQDVLHRCRPLGSRNDLVRQHDVRVRFQRSRCDDAPSVVHPARRSGGNLRVDLPLCREACPELPQVPALCAVCAHATEPAVEEKNMRNSTAVVLVSLALVFVRVNLAETFLATDFGEAVGVGLLFIAICVATIGGLLRLLECPHPEKTRMNTNKLTSQSR